MDKQNLLGGVRARAPLRLGLAGGGTDLSPFSNQFGGLVMNATISLFAYAHLVPRYDGRVLFEAAELGYRFEHAAGTEVPLDTGTLLHCGVYNRMVRQFNRGNPLPISLLTTVDVPAGSGLGGSSALVVALVKAFQRYLGLSLTEYDIASLAYSIEREDLKIAGGKQDQYAATFGGFNFMEFYGEGRVIINPLRINTAVLRELEAGLVLYFTGSSRSSALVIEKQQTEIANKNSESIAAMLALKREATEMKDALLTGDLSSVAATMNRGWAAKKATASGVSTSEIERLLDLALANGALAGKVSGAGGGGFLLVLADPVERHRVVNVLAQERGKILPAIFTNEGVCSWRQMYSYTDRKVDQC